MGAGNFAEGRRAGELAARLDLGKIRLAAQRSEDLADVVHDALRRILAESREG